VRATDGQCSDNGNGRNYRKQRMKFCVHGYMEAALITTEDNCPVKPMIQK
jgi:hypothetical protein